MQSIDAGKNQKFRAIRLTYGGNPDLAIRRGAWRTRFAFSSLPEREQMAMSFRSRRCVVPPSQQRGSEQVWQVNPSSKGDGLPRGILTGPHSQGIVFSKEASHNRVLRKAHRSKHCLETAPSALQKRSDLGCAGKLVSRNAQLSEGPGFACCAGETDLVLTRNSSAEVLLAGPVHPFWAWYYRSVRSDPAVSPLITCQPQPSRRRESATHRSAGLGPCAVSCAVPALPIRLDAQSPAV